MITITRFTKEQLIEKAKENVEFFRERLDLMPQSQHVALSLHLAEITLASLEAEPVAWIVHARTGDQLTNDGGYVANAEGILGLNSTPLYTAPPAPVSVPDENGLLPRPCCGGKADFDYDDDNLNWISCSVCGIATDTAYHTDVDARDKLREVWNSRAAMLQGSQPVTTAYKLPFEQWLSQQTGTIDVECGCVMTEVFFHWLRVAYEAGNSPVIPDRWIPVSERVPADGDIVLVVDDGYFVCEAQYRDGDFYSAVRGNDELFETTCRDVELWMPLPAAPQQEAE
jgi:hypothetical protein